MGTNTVVERGFLPAADDVDGQSGEDGAPCEVKEAALVGRRGSSPFPPTDTA